MIWNLSFPGLCSSAMKSHSDARRRLLRGSPFRFSAVSSSRTKSSIPYLPYISLKPTRAAALGRLFLVWRMRALGHEVRQTAAREAPTSIAKNSFASSNSKTVNEPSGAFPPVCTRIPRSARARALLRPACPGSKREGVWNSNHSRQVLPTSRPKPKHSILGVPQALRHVKTAETHIHQKKPV